LLARDAAVGRFSVDLDTEAQHLSIPGVTADPHFSGVYCCQPGSALVLKTVYYNQCTPGPGVVCYEVLPGELDSRYTTNSVVGTCTTWMGATPTPCAHPAAPSRPGSCLAAPNPPNCPGDSVVVTLTAAGAQVITPLVRPFFSSPGVCPDSSTPSHCYVSLSNSVTMRFEGDTL